MKSDKNKLATTSINPVNAQGSAVPQESQAQYLQRVFGKQVEPQSLMEKWGACKINSKAMQSLVYYHIAAILCRIAEFAISPALCRSHVAEVIPLFAVKSNGEILAQARSESYMLYFADCASTLNGTANPFKMRSDEVYGLIASKVNDDVFNLCKTGLLASIKSSGAVAEKITSATAAINKADYKAVITAATKLSETKKA
jgi:hypothetical protein